MARGTGSREPPTSLSSSPRQRPVPCSSGGTRPTNTWRCRCPTLRQWRRPMAVAIESTGDSFAILPPGPSRIVVKTPGTVARVFSSKASDLTAAAINADTYADGAPEVAPITPWPDPVGGFKLRHYRLADYDSPDPS